MSIKLIVFKHAWTVRVYARMKFRNLS